MTNRIILGEFRALEEALWAEISRLQGGDPLRRITVVAPTGMLVRRLKSEAAKNSPNGLMGVRFTNLFQFAQELGGDDFHPDKILAERILLRWLEKNPMRAPLTYDLAGAMRGAIRDLKDADVSSDPRDIVARLTEAVEGEDGFDYRITAYDIKKFGDLMTAYIYYEQERERLKIDDLPDVFRRATANPNVGEPVLLYGFYDVTQVQADFIQELSRRTTVTFFVPAGVDKELWKFGDWFREFANSCNGKAERVESGEPLEPELVNAAGSRDEIHFSAKRIRALLDKGTPADRIAVVARTLDPYVTHIEEVFRENCIPASSLPGRPLSEHPLAKVIRLLFRSGGDDHPRGAVMDVVLHPLFKADADRRYWDYLARTLRIGRGKDWDRLRGYTKKGYVYRHGRESDPDSRKLEIPPSQVKGLHDAVGKVRRGRIPSRGDWKKMAKAHLARLDLFDRKSMDDTESEVYEEVRSILGRLATLDRLGETIKAREFLEAFDRELDRAKFSRPPGAGVAVLDAMGIRGLSFDHVFVVGMNAHVFPRFIVDEPFISDAVRRHVIRVLGSHLPIRRDGYDEERLLWHLVQSSARESLVCVYQRADASGSQRDPSPFLPKQDAWSYARGLRAKLEQVSILTPMERIVVTSERETWIREFGMDTGSFRRAKDMLDALWKKPLSPWEGMVGETAVSGDFSPTRLERYGTCPFQYFAEHVLRIFPYDETEEGDDLTPMEIGSLQHLILEYLFRRLDRLGYEGYDLDREVTEASKEASAKFEKRFGIALDGLLGARRDQAARFVRNYAAWELGHLDGWRPEGYESRGKAEIAGLTLIGKIDRVDRHPSGRRRVIDYKRRWGDHWKTKLHTQAKNGKKLQGPMYLEFEKADEAVFAFIEDYTTDDPRIRERRAVLSREDWEEVRGDVERVIRVFTSLMKKGTYFIHPGGSDRFSHCTRCDYAQICRKGFAGLAKKARESESDYWTVVKT